MPCSAHKRFCQLLPRETRGQALQTRVPKSRLLTLPELRVSRPGASLGRARAPRLAGRLPQAGRRGRALGWH